MPLAMRALRALPSNAALSILAIVAVLAAMVFVTFASPASAASMKDDIAFTDAYYVRAAPGNVPLTEPTEAANQWNVVQYIRLTHAAGTPSTASFGVPSGATIDGFACTCGNYTTRVDGALQVVTVAASEPSGQPIVALRTHQGLTSAFTFSLPQPSSSGDATIQVYVPAGSVATSNLAADVKGMPSTSANPGLMIYSFKAKTEQLPGNWISVFPGTETTTTPAPTTSNGMSPWLYAAAGLVIGCIVWALLVSKGMVQSRSRKQVVQTAAHVEAASNDPPQVLEARKRFLMDALKNIELAKQNNELDNQVYDAVKSDFKRQTVTVMRAIEETKAAEKADKAAEKAEKAEKA